MSTTLTYKEVTIRTPHKCWGCLREFSIGSKMNYWSCVDGSRINSGYSCKTCDEIQKIIIDPMYDDGIQQGEIASECAKGQTPEELLAELKAQRTAERVYQEMLREKQLANKDKKL